MSFFGLKMVNHNHLKILLQLMLGLKFYYQVQLPLYKAIHALFENCSIVFRISGWNAKE